MTKRRVAIVGAGASGLITASVLREDLNFDIKVFEKNNFLGSVWKYISPSTYNLSSEALNPMYKSLITNLPIEVMEINRESPINKPQPPKVSSYVGHEDVYSYLQNYADRQQLSSLIRFSTLVTDITEWELNPSKWRLKFKESYNDQNLEIEEIFDFVVICNGHYNKPFRPSIDGIESFKGISMHSIE
jgi:cation diffusion facilitator CzcD-associated flavoprotein CzcO